jgi:hypothetical protein
MNYQTSECHVTKKARINFLFFSIIISILYSCNTIIIPQQNSIATVSKSINTTVSQLSASSLFLSTSTLVSTNTNITIPSFKKTNTYTRTLTPSETRVFDTNRWITNGPRGGSIQDIDISMSDPTTLFVNTWDTIYKSNDSGSTWSIIDDRQIREQKYSIAIDPTNANTIYAGTLPSGVFKSTNGGIDWKVSNDGFPENTLVSDLVIDPITPTNLYATGFDLYNYINQNPLHINL